RVGCPVTRRRLRLQPRRRSAGRPASLRSHRHDRTSHLHRRLTCVAVLALRYGVAVRGVLAFPSDLRSAPFRRGRSDRRPTVATNEPHTERAPGALSADISRLVVRLVAEYTGRGPTKARTTIRDDTIICVTQDNMTKAERRLTADGETDPVVTIRRQFPT